MKKDEVYIGIFGKRNQGKSSLMNLLAGQDISIVSDTPGTTTDPVKKSCEIFGIGKCVFVDTAGFDEQVQADDLGKMRVEKTFDYVQRLDMAILLISENSLAQAEKDFARLLAENSVPFIIVHNKADVSALSPGFASMLARLYPQNPLVDFSVREALEAAAPLQGATLSQKAEKNPCEPILKALRALYEKHGAAAVPPRPALEGLIKAGDCVVLVCPIDGEAPTERLILPQVLFARQCLDFHALPVLCQLEELEGVFGKLRQKPALVITDSQVFGSVSKRIPATCPLTSFSICLAKQKGNFEHYLAGTSHLAKLKDHDRVLMLESCTHQINCHDIGRVKLPALLQAKTGKKLEFVYVSGLDPLPDDLSGFAMAVQCGGCMVSARQLENRIKALVKNQIPVSNYGMTLAWCNGIFDRATAMFR